MTARQMHVIIRRARPSDAPAVAELYLRARRAASAAGTISPPAHDDDEVRGWVADVVIGRQECWLAQREPAAPVGMLVLKAGWVDQLYVEPELTRTGIGAQLLAVAKRRRPDGLRLWTFVSNPDAQRFYLRHGFREVRRNSCSHNEERAPDIEYVWGP